MNEQYSYRTYYTKVVKNVILNNFSIAYAVQIHLKIFLMKLKGLQELFVKGKIPYSQYRNKNENAEETKDLFPYRRIFVISVFVKTVFDSIGLKFIIAVSFWGGRGERWGVDGGCPLFHCNSWT